MYLLYLLYLLLLTNEYSYCKIIFIFLQKYGFLEP